MKDNGHVLIKIREVVDWFSVKLFLIEQKEGKEAFNALAWQILHERHRFIPTIKYLSAFAKGKITEIYEIRSGDSESEF
jgi:hypothetical protein